MGHPPRIPVWLKPDQSVVYFLTFCVAKIVGQARRLPGVRVWPQRQAGARPTIQFCKRRSYSWSRTSSEKDEITPDITRVPEKLIVLT